MGPLCIITYSRYKLLNTVQFFANLVFHIRYEAQT